ncbi:class I adenylate-forming enzyme family protein [Streptomyces viridochromogenes]|uniref:class I adenylate-forming enzyme family protein n=1 Tax=Streptomyces viridochromogenes TaxID=1938 RepID=UPI0001B50E5C|nr:class I adenylate-forming enzyme family protein [Streptomyces viridochromogenes]
MSENTLLHHLLDAAAQAWPERPAVSRQESTSTFTALRDASHRLAAWLHAQGVGRGRRVVIAVPSGPLVPALVFAASRLGAPWSVLHEQVRGVPLEHVLDDCEPSLVVAEDPASRQAARDRGVVAAGPEDLLPIAFPEPGTAAPVERLTLPEPLAVDPVCLIYTSGTTSLPKAVVSTHQQVVFAARAIQQVLRYQDDDVVYCPLPLSFDYGLYQIFLGALSGAHVVLGGAAEAGPALLRSLLDSKATVLPAVPSVAESLVWLLKRATAQRPPLRLVTNTGAALSTETVNALRAALPGLRAQVMYGLTECKRAVIMPPDGDLERPGSCGLPLPGTEILIVDDRGEPVPAGVVGEIVVRGPHVMAGYWRRPELHAQRFPRRDGLFPELRTGDYGHLDEDGYLYFSGRRDDLYKERGFRVSATEVEAAAHRVPGVVSAAVLPPSGKRPAVLAVVAEMSAEQVLGGMRDQIEEFKVPRRCVVLEELPLSGNGKVDRKKLATVVEGRSGLPGRA